MIKRLIFIVNLFFLVSCAFKQEKLRTVRASRPLGFDEVQCRDHRVQLSKKVRKITKLVERNRLLIDQSPSGRTYTPVFNIIGGKIAEISTIKKTYESPLILSEKILWDYYLEIKSVINREFEAKVRDDLNSYLFEEKGGQLNFKQQLAKINELSFYIKQLGRLSSRWQGKQCEIKSLTSKQTNDLRPFLKLKDIKIEEIEWARENWTEIDRAHKKFDIKQKIIDLCLFRGRNNQYCQGNAFSYWRSDFNYFRQKYRQFFQIKDRGIKARCQVEKSDDQTFKKLIIPFTASSNGTDIRNYIDRGIRGFWKNKSSNFSIDFVEEADAGKNSLVILEKGGENSYVNLDRPNQIVIGKKLKNEKYKIVAHEFGHVLGFPDCYIEFFDPKNKEIVYYELDQKNLMCSLNFGSKIGPQQIKMIQKKYCSND